MRYEYRFAVVSDSFKGALSSIDAGNAIAAGIRMALGNLSVIRVFPAADGGEGTAAALGLVLEGQERHITVADPFGKPVNASYFDLGISSDRRRTAVFDMAACAGLTLAHKHGLDPLSASTFGVGEMIIHLCRDGFQRIYIGLGGSGTNDGGAGALSAMGAQFTDANGRLLNRHMGGGDLIQIAEADLTAVFTLLSRYHVELIPLYDVALPLTGEMGASRMFAPQKGASPEMVVLLENGMLHFAHVLSSHYGWIHPAAEGCGAAGGLGFGLYAAGGTLTPGAQAVLGVNGYLEMLSSGCDLVFTGEGRTDVQTAHGKLPYVVAQYAARSGVPCVDMCGSAEILPDHTLYDSGMTAVFPIVQGPMTLADSMAFTAEQLTKTAYNAVRLWLANR